MKTVLEFTEKHNILEVDGVEYEVPQRTPVLEEQIREHDKKIAELSEYESNYSLLEIMFGKKATKQMFPDRATTNLDKLAACSKLAVQLFMAGFNEIQSNDLNNKLSELDPMLNKIDALNKTMQSVKNTTAVRRKK